MPLILGDCQKEMQKIESHSIDLILTDPPYGLTDLHWDCVVPLPTLWKEWQRLLKPRGLVVLSASQPYTSAVVMSNPKWFRTEWIWVKNAGSNFATVKWHPMKEHESVLVFGSGPGTYNPVKQLRTQELKVGYTNKSNTGKRKAYSGVTINKGFTVKDGTYRVPSSVQKWNRERGLHPNQKPLKMILYFMSTYSNEGDIVLDPFAGSATVGVAASQLKRKFIGIENDPTYYRIAKRRLRSEEALRRSIHP